MVSFDNNADFEFPAITPSRASLIACFQQSTAHPNLQTLFNPDYLLRREAYPAASVPAAVLIPIIEKNHELYVLFTQRSEQLSKHAGQISFPGGRVESGDHDAATAALRESFEEIGLNTHQINLLGALPPYLTSTGFAVTPVVGLIDADFTAQCNTDEVTAIFLVPLHYLMNPANYTLHVKEENDHHHAYYDLQYQEHRIWGVTAAILFGLYEALLGFEMPTL